MNEFNAIFELEQLSRAAWPAAQVEELDGWQMRFNDGVTRRANSVWPNIHHGNMPLTKKIETVEDRYRAVGLPARYQVCPATQPSVLSSRLIDRGYTPEGRSHVQTADVQLALQKCNYSPFYGFEVSHHADDAWFELGRPAVLNEQAKARQLSRLAIMQRIPAQAVYVTGLVAQTKVAQVMGVIDNGWIGIFSLYTDTAWRGQGAATAVMYTLLRWGLALGATKSYLQVMTNNRSALRLYHRLGYETQHDYYYLTEPPR